MIPTIWTAQRRLVPRWRSLAVTIDAKELASPAKIDEKKASYALADHLLEKLSMWRNAPSIIAAGELVEAALVEARETEAISAARFLLDERSTATLPLKRLAGLALKRAGRHAELPAALTILPRVDKNIWRKRTRLYPQNPLGWVELALFDVASGCREAALRSMLVALQLAPNDRHVLRSAARLFLHLHDPTKAYDILAKSGRTPTDPWLIAAELSIAELAHRKPRYFEQGRRMVDQGQFYPRQISELSGAMATLELQAGRKKRARDLFRQSTLDPTGNALAQAEWASPAFGIELVSSHRLVTAPEADEATVFHLLRSRQYRDVPNACKRWSDAEPYSIRPFEIGSSTSGMIGDLEQALEFADKGLLVRPDAPILLNNRAFVLAHVGRLKEAEQCLRPIGQDDEKNWLIKQANLGLIEMRRGNYDAGSKHYSDATEGFKKAGNALMSEVAKLFFAREAAVAGLPAATELVAACRDNFKKTDMAAFEHVLIEGENALASSNREENSRIAPTK
ncbi:tetratricopeptide repeat protein [Mesorhizobium sp. CA7]|uniref:tetratricopeptide repeat protein n=1 Tax=Mesorhizobium sp. CA7 TaxID=588501 RepID=UPI001CCBBFD2|nr:hypothetical protein [Mesorhizobium sp. CA7]MBZ9817625.1 hypothetical protein [Mesorhizobium sp. CA7]